MKNILLIDGSKKFLTSEGRLSKTLHNVAKETLISLNKTVEETIIDSEYDLEEEVLKILKADAIIFQMPAWWMGIPWTVKKYIDTVYMQGYGRFFENDGRSSQDPSRKYGTGGLLKGKKYMISVTWNAPIEAFEEKDNFFEGLGVDGVYFSFHKIQEFVGMNKLPSFMCNDVIKNPNIELYIENYKNHLQKVFA